MTVQQPPPVAETTPSGARQRALIIVLVLVAVVGLLFVLLMGGGEEEDNAAPVTPTRRPTASPSPTPSEGLPPESSEDFDGRDPFQPLVTADDGGGGGGGDGGTPTPTPTTSRLPGEDGGETRTVSLLDIFREDGERFATVDVEGDQFTVAEGETFADNFRLLDLTSECGTFVFGDERFTLCIGQEVRK